MGTRPTRHESISKQSIRPRKESARTSLSGQDRGQDPKGSRAKSRTRDAADAATAGQSTDAPPAEPTPADPSADPPADPSAEPPAPEPESVPSSALDIGSTPDAPDVPQTNLRAEEAKTKREVRVDPPPGRAALEADERAPVKLVPQADRASSRAARKRARLQKDLDEAKQAIDSSETPSLSIEILQDAGIEVVDWEADISSEERALRSVFQTLCFRARIQLTSHSHT